RLPARQRVDAVDLMEAAALPEGPRGLVRLVARRRVEGLELHDRDSLCGKVSKRSLDQGRAGSGCLAIGSHGGEGDLGRARIPMLDQYEPDDVAAIDGHPGAVLRKAPTKVVVGIGREVGGQGGEDFDARLEVFGRRV